MSDKEPCPPEEYPIRDLDHMNHLVKLAEEAETEYITIPSGLTREQKRQWIIDKAKELNRQ